MKLTTEEKQRVEVANALSSSDAMDFTRDRTDSILPRVIKEFQARRSDQRQPVSRRARKRR